MQRATIILFFFPFLFLNFTCQATHIVGGDISYECLGPGSNGNMEYKIIMHVYRDFINGQAPFDDPAIIGIYTGQNSNILHRKVNLFSPVIATVPIDLGNPCLVVPNNVGVQEALYEGTIELPYNPNGYWFSYQRCCRNGSIGNLNSPGNTGATYTIFLSGLAQQQCNNSPTYNDFPPIVVCINRPLEFDHAATDADGNTLRYELCAPFTGGSSNDPIPDPPSPPPYLPVQFGFGFSPTNPMVAAPGLSIDSITGFLTGFPTAFGQYSVGVCVKEYDAQGNLLSTTLRDFQFNVTNCDDQVQAGIPADSANFTANQIFAQFCSDTTITFDNTSSITTFINSYEWRFDFGNGTIFTSAAFEPTVPFPGNGTYQGWLVANPGSTGCTDTAFLNISVSADLKADFSMFYDSCKLDSVLFTNTTPQPNSTINSYRWTFGDGNTSNKKNPLHLYNYPDVGSYTVSLAVTDSAGCISTAEQVLDWRPEPIFSPNLESDTACVPIDATTFQSTYYPISGYLFAWDFGDGNTSTETIPTHTYREAGTYIRKLTIRSPKGCIDKFSSTHVLLDTPKAAFSYLPITPTSFEPLVEFTDQSEFANQWEWQFGNGVTRFSPFEGSISYTYPDTGKHTVSLIVTHPNGCTDTAQQIVDIIPQFTYFLPNALTPNDDGSNDVYMGKGLTQYIKRFELTIHSRWGEEMFRTNSPTEAWNGRKNNIGQKCQAGVYVVMVRIIGPRGKQREIKGFATIVY